ncbi:hypothetical protein CEXT_796431 [Caerostris extrusa]|uniref:Uncharacterized protein n=1 Tax=Caerostris extrusa TaxID=172846 RepID=A0AAV4VGM0_CAEEX|nr:hypothetical protein CEXT_796431 [Caerostris extrusa]
MGGYEPNSGFELEVPILLFQFHSISLQILRKSPHKPTPLPVRHKCKTHSVLPVDKAPVEKLFGAGYWGKIGLARSPNGRQVASPIPYRIVCFA